MMSTLSSHQMPGSFKKKGKVPDCFSKKAECISEMREKVKAVFFMDDRVLINPAMSSLAESFTSGPYCDFTTAIV